MKIIKHGNLKLIRFKCTRCECEFAADMNEYKKVHSMNEKYFMVNCPECNTVVYELEQEAKIYDGCTINEETKNKTKCKDCDHAVKGFFRCAPEKYVCIGVKEPFVIEDINTECTEY